MTRPPIDQQKLTNWYNFQARFYHLWRDDYSSPLLKAVAAEIGAGNRELAVLDAGCGTGWLSIGLARSRPRWRVEGLDVAEGMLAVARRQAERFRLANAAFRRGDVGAVPHDDGSFDAVVAAGLFPNLNDWQGALQEFFRVLRTGGRLVVSELDRQAMSPQMRLFVRVMIFGYRLFSTVAPRFRFSDRWNLGATTIDRAALSSQARAAGFVESGVSSLDGNLILVFDKGGS